MLEWIVIIVLSLVLLYNFISSLYESYYLGKISFKEERYISYEVGRKYYFHVLFLKDKDYVTEKIEVSKECYESFNVGDKFGILR